ncbi:MULTISPECIES: penicillin-binding transpeptidase domain-containing protein [unclassified Parvimonas]|uniref:penicillin-binding transpeptidase domain-containing protein n=1 Tax=unclassified Parvimonas TaxID=1151464 RepID=UPI002B4A8CEA|nr:MULTISPECIES: penicillin-binding transpeptidase domain-containing protein [unclassified Parvimonas]MEB3025323.1 penicillin-binding transpeptidase domain-containing protein [Parvimonas sp. M13]MEB3089433.1 penicillin-binding transpeptidase domain-containing protein [Parvimonas sp. M20]
MKNKKYTIKNKTVSSRSAVLFFIFIILFSVIVAKLAYLQLYSKNKYSVEQFKDSVNYTPLEAKRGSIFDRNGNILAKSISVYNGYFSTLDYNRYKKSSGKVKDAETQKLDKIFDILQLNKEEIFEKADQYNNLLIKKDITEEQNAVIKSKNSLIVSVTNNKEVYFSVLEYEKFKLYSQKAKEAEEKKLDEIFSALEIDKKKIFDRADRGTNFKIKKSISPELAKEIKEINSSIISVEIEQSRNYIDGTLAPFVVGHANENGGQSGIENYLNDSLSGTNGSKRVIRENLNKSVEDVVEAKNGKDIYLTIDSTIQKYVSEYAKQYYDEEKPIKMSVIVSDVTNGDILAMDSFPKYDTNNPNVPLDDNALKEFENLDEKEKLKKIFSMWRNPAVSDAYEPGSVFKLITASSSLEEKTDTLDSTFFCNGFIRDIPGVTLRCFNWQNPHGKETFTDALDNSCNPAFVQMVRHLGKEKFYRYINGFGFGNKTGINLPGESNGQIPKSISDIGAAELATMSYGHGISVTPIQMIMAANAVVNGGNLLEPQIDIKNVEKDKDNKLKIKENEAIVKNQIISKETSDKMRALMEHGVTDGIVKKVYSNNVRIGGKSGTTIKAVNGKYDDKKTIASLYIAFPIENPKYSILIVFDEPKANVGGTSVCAPLAKKLAEKIAEYKQIAKTNNENGIVRKTKVPDVRGLTLEYAADVLKGQFLNYSVEGASSPKSVVTGQSEEPQKNLVEGSTVKLTLSDDENEKLLVVDFSKMTYQQAMDVVNKMGYKYKTSGGKGKFVSSNKEIGSYISKDEELVLTFED